MFKSLLSGLLNLAESWKTFLFLCMALIILLCANWVLVKASGQNAVGWGLYLMNQKVNNIQIAGNGITIPPPAYVHALDYVEGSDSLLAAYLHTGKHLLILSCPKDCHNEASRNLIPNSTYDSIMVLRQIDPGENYFYGLVVNGDTAICYHIKDYQITNHSIENIYIPHRCLNMEIQGEKIIINDAIEYLRRMVYHDSHNFKWHVIGAESGPG